MVVGWWLLQSRRVWYSLALLFPGFSAFFWFFLAAWVMPIIGLQEGSKVSGGVAAPGRSPVPRTSAYRPGQAAPGRGLNGG